MAKTYVRVKGIQEAVRELERRGLSAIEAAKTAVRAGAEVVAQDARGKAPQDTGELASSIAVTSVRKYRAGARATVRPRARHGYYQEVGTKHHGKQPFMEPAAEASQSKVVEAAKGVYRAALER